MLKTNQNQPTAMKTCPKCGQPQPLGALTCYRCGHIFQTPFASAPSQTVAFVPVHQSPSPVVKYKVWIAAALALVVGYLVVFQWILPTYRPPLVGSWKRQGLEITFGVGGTGTATTRPYEPRVSQVRTKYGEPESGINPLEIAGIGSGPIDFNWKRQGNLLWVRPIQRSDWPDPVRWIVSEDGQQLSLYSDSGVFTLYRFE